MGKVLIGNIKGPQGPTGVRGGMWIQGTAVTGTSTEETSFPDSNIAYAIVGDAYFNTDTCNTYKCTVAGNPTDAKWVYTGNIRGGKGDTGDTQTIQNAVLDFNEALTRENIKSTDTVETIFGKVKKYFTDLGTAAFMNVVNNVTQSEAGQAVLDAAVGKYLEEKKFDISKIIANRNITEPGFVMDGKTVADALTELNGKLIIRSKIIIQANTVEEVNTCLGNLYNELSNDSISNKSISVNTHGASLDGGRWDIITSKTTSNHGYQIAMSYAYTSIKLRILENGSWSSWNSFILNSDLGYVNCEVTTVANTAVVIPNSPSSSYYIPSIQGHWSTNIAHESVFYGDSAWRMYSSVSQKVGVRFYKYPV